MSFRTFEYTQSGMRPDQSRYNFKYSGCTWTPSPADLRLDALIAAFAETGLSDSYGPQQQLRMAWQGIRSNGPHVEILEDDYEHTVTPDDHYRPNYSASRTGRSQYSRASARTSDSRKQKMIEYQQSKTSKSSRASHIHRLPPVDETDHERQLMPYLQASSEVGPQDSVSQVSSQPRSVRRYRHNAEEGRRGRTRYRDQRWGPISEMQQSQYGTQQPGYSTRIVTPYD